MTAVGTADNLHASASRITGLADFGPDDYTDGLAVLVESYARDAELTPAGEKATRALLRGALMARLLGEAGWQAHPGYAEVAVERPVFVTGLPRTGTTALHRLLVADPAHQGLELWLAEAPQPRPPRAAWADDPVFQYIAAACARHHVEHPEFMGVHYVAADQVEECWQLLRQSMRSVSFECLAHLPTYSAWLRDQDWTGAYRRPASFSPISCRLRRCRRYAPVQSCSRNHAEYVGRCARHSNETERIDCRSSCQHSSTWSAAM